MKNNVIMRKIGEVFKIEGVNTWLRAAEAHPSLWCFAAEDPAYHCVFRTGTGCICTGNYKRDTGECGRAIGEGPRIIFLRTIAPTEVTALGPRKCIKCPNSVTTVGKEYELEVIVGSNNFRYIDDIGEYTYILKEDIHLFFAQP